MTSGNNTVVAAVDLGNTRAKIFMDGESLAVEYKVDWFLQLKNFLLRRSAEQYVVGVSSVQPRTYNHFISEVKNIQSLRIIEVHSLIEDKSLGIDLSGTEGMGTDRILGLYGGTLHCSPPFMTVDCGTAITINILDAEYRCRGGAILPGVSTQLQALHDYTGRLPLVQAQALPEHTAGTTTEQAIRIGVVRGAAGAIINIADRIRRELFGGNNIPIFLTGGDAAMLQEELSGWRYPLRHEPELVREGILTVTQRFLERETNHSTGGQTV